MSAGAEDVGLVKYDGNIIETTVAPEDLLKAFPRPFDPYAGAGAVPFSKEAQRVLSEPLRDDEIEIRPDDGMLYLPGVRYRRKLNEAFGMGGWAMVPRGDPHVDDATGTVFYTGRLYVLGRYVAEAMGKGKWIKNNAKSDYGTALESARTDALTRCCKDFVATELWDPTFSRAWVAKHCVRVRNPDEARFGRGDRVWLKRTDPALAPPPPPAPNVPVPPTDRRTGEPIVGAWPKMVRDPSTEGAREMDAQFRRTMDAPAVDDILEAQLQKSIDANIIEVIDRKTGEVTRETKASHAQVTYIHILQRELQIPDDEYRAGMRKKYGIDSTAVMTKAQASDMIDRLERYKDRLPPERKEQLRKEGMSVPDVRVTDGREPGSDDDLF